MHYIAKGQTVHYGAKGQTVHSIAEGQTVHYRLCVELAVVARGGAN